MPLLQQSLSLKLSQHLALTPQLQQAIQLLQLSALELQAKIQEVVESNPMLEIDEDKQNATQTSVISEPLLPQLSCDISKTQKGGKSDFIMEYDLENNSAITDNLQDYLYWQKGLTHFTERDEAIATVIIDAIDENGFLNQSISELEESIGKSGLGDERIYPDEIEAVLQRIQHFDPPGIAARNLQECLILQLEEYPKNTKGSAHALEILKTHMNHLAEHDYANIKKRCHLNEEELEIALDLIHSLSPRPGQKILSEEINYIIPDLIVKKQGDTWQVSLNESLLPRVKINTDYTHLIKRGNNSPDNVFMRDHLQEARWFIKSLQSRYETLLKVSTAIIEHQIDFLEHGAEKMKPLVLHEIAQSLELHESTISRVTTGKYIYTPRGLFELKYFFSSHVGTASGGECSSTAIRAFIKKLVLAENPQKPLSDNKIATLLQAEGIDVARRTITKYRETLQIPPSHERKLPSFIQRH